MMKVFKYIFCTVIIFIIQFSLCQNENVCNDFPDAYPAVSVGDHSYCKNQPNLTNQKCTSTADCLIYGNMAVCGSDGNCTCGTLKPKSGDGREIAFRIGPNPDLNSYFTNSCVIPINETCPVGFDPFCETTYCYQCLCIDPPIEDPSFKAELKYPEGREKSNCLNMTNLEKLLDKGNLTNLEKPLDKENLTNLEKPLDKENITNLEKPLFKENITDLEKPLVKENITDLEKPLDKENMTNLEKPFDKENLANLEKPLDKENMTDLEKPENMTDLEKTLDKENMTHLEKPLSKDNMTNVEQPLNKDNMTSLEQPLNKDNMTSLEKPLDKENMSDLQKPLGKANMTNVENPLDKENMTDLEKPLDKENKGNEEGTEGDFDFDGVDISLIHPPGHGYTLSPDDNKESSLYKVQPRKEPDVAEEPEYLLPQHLLLHNPEAFMRDIMNIRTVYLQHRGLDQNVLNPGKRRKQDQDVDNGSGLSKLVSYPFLIQIAWNLILIRAIFH